ncbi:hypothetical protein WR25_23156 [Diploscapter pachys]|uniref:Trehalase n=1 Tax=Diploscapter pachys TaxID=2018661 RepID=A0A2A2LZS0_9BILA|nr:hypothetical protein WR25_23156 [Diploscapter pachys]
MAIATLLLTSHRWVAAPKLALLVRNCSAAAGTEGFNGKMQQFPGGVSKTDHNNNEANPTTSPSKTTKLAIPVQNNNNGKDLATAKEPDPIAFVTGQSGMKTAKQLIYCEGSLLHAVQTAKLFADCKHFVDMPLKSNAEDTLSKWRALETAGPLNAGQIAQFVKDHFDEPEGELVQCEPIDWIPELTFDNIKDAEYRLLTHRLHLKWPSLYRRVSDRVLLNPERFSIIPVPNPFVVPGGRYGFIPNGNRLYYLNRSQPPLLTWCVYEYYKATHDLEFVAKLLPTLRKELAFFQANRSITLDGWIGPLFRFAVATVTPRPESYREDVESARHLATDEEKRVLWGDIAAAAESGRDFSSRWFARQGQFAGQLKSTRTSQIVPVELNAIVCGNLKMMGDLYDAVGDIDGSKWCAIMYDTIRRTIHQVLWNEEKGCWFDFDLVTCAQIDEYVDTNFFPMAMDATHEGFDGAKIVEYLNKSGALGFAGGLPTSLTQSGEQWDFPNAWAPTTWIAIHGLMKCDQKELAIHIADKWVRKNYNMWRNSGGKMFEKYNVESSCFKQSYGGEYEVQEGFGWSNGVIIDLLMTFGDVLEHSKDDNCKCCDEEENCPELPK